MLKVAFIITVYNNDNIDYFIQAIDSIIEQDYGFENINIYLGIDGKLKNEFESYISNNSNSFYKIHRQSENKGLAFILNRLIEMIEDEEYIFRMDSDDISLRHRVSRQIEVLNSNKDLLLVGSNIIEVNEKGCQILEKIMPSKFEDIIKYSIYRNPFNHPTIVFRKDFFDKVGMYNEKFIKAQDYELWARAIKLGINCMNINESLLYFRVTKDFIKKRNQMSNYLNELKISFALMMHLKRYDYLPLILLKLIIRISPLAVGNFFYKISRRKKMKFSVLMSIYYKEKPEYFDRAMRSIWDEQTIRPHEVVFVQDGVLTNELYELINEWKSKIGNSFKTISLAKNVGLGNALNEGLKYCSYELIARMDTDDIAIPNRFEKQLKVFENSDIDVCSSWVSEFENDENEIVSYRRIPENHNDIVIYSKIRNGINHPAVMYKKFIVQKAGGYQRMMWFEDYYLWARIILSGGKFYNIQEPLVNMRAGYRQLERRGGIKYAIEEFTFLKRLNVIGFLTTPQFLKSVFTRFIVRILPKVY